MWVTDVSSEGMLAAGKIHELRTQKLTIACQTRHFFTDIMRSKLFHMKSYGNPKL